MWLWMLSTIVGTVLLWEGVKGIAQPCLRAMGLEIRRSPASDTLPIPAPVQVNVTVDSSTSTAAEEQSATGHQSRPVQANVLSTASGSSERGSTSDRSRGRHQGFFCASLCKNPGKLWRNERSYPFPLPTLRQLHRGPFAYPNSRSSSYTSCGPAAQKATVG